MPNGHQHTRAVYIVSHICGALCLPSVTDTLVTYISFLMYTLPRDHGVLPTHSCRIMCLICMVPRVHGASQTHSCCIKCIRFKQFQSIPISMTFCKHHHYIIILISFELFVTITLPPFSRQGIEIIPYIKRFLE
jgi:hypothetical protein